MGRIKKSGVIYAFLSILMASLTLISCEPMELLSKVETWVNGEDRIISIPVSGVTLTKESTSVLVGGAEQLFATVEPADATIQDVTWASADDAIATVDAAGVVTGVVPGTATITATTVDGGFSDTCTVTVSAVEVPVTGVSLNKSITIIPQGETELLNATISPANATNRNLTWTTTDAGRATVNAAGLVTAVAVGSATITVTAVDGGYTDSCEVTTQEKFIMSGSGGSAGNNQSFTEGTLSFNMKYVPGKTFPTGTDDAGLATVTNSFWMGETVVTYELWYAVRYWAENTASPAYSLANDGLEGNDGTIGAVPTPAKQEPVTYINWRDAMVWCNALTEYYNANNGSDLDLDCAYYTNSDYATPLRTSTNSITITFTTPGSEDMPYIKASTNENTDMANCISKGFRFHGSMEWELSARWRTDSTNTVNGYSNPWFTKGNSASGAYTYYYDTADTNPSNGVVDGKDANDKVAVYIGYWNGSTWVSTGVTSTAVVKSKGSTGYNSLGIYDMSGNVWEWCFDWYTVGAYRVRRGGGWDSNADGLRAGGLYYCTPDYKDISTGFRFARSAD